MSLRPSLLALCLTLLAGQVEAAAPWQQESRDGDPFAVARQGELELAVGCDDGRLVMTYAVPKAALAPELLALPKVFLVLDYDGGGTGLYYFYQSRLRDGGTHWLTEPIPKAIVENIRMLAAARTNIRVGLSAAEPEMGFTLLHEAWVASKGSQAAVKPALQACGVPLK